MGRASRRKHVILDERARARPSGPGRRVRWTAAAWVGGTLAALGVAAFFVFNAARTPTVPPPAGHGQPVADTAPYPTTSGSGSLADFRGSKLVLYFYEGAG